MRNRMNKLCEQKSRFAIRKLTIGTCSVALGSLLMHAGTVWAAETEEVSPNAVVSEQERINDIETTSSEHVSETVEDVRPASDNIENVGNASEVQINDEEAMADNNDYTLHYTRPAANTYEGWEHESLPIGNGEIGSKVFGLIGAERIQFNEKTLWSGGPQPDSTTYNGGNFPNRHTALAPIREALERGDIQEAKRLAESQLVGPNNREYGRYLSFGDINIDFTNQRKTLDSVTAYRRDLDLNTAIASTTYTQDGTEFRRESFVSYPDDVAVTHFEKTGDKPLDFAVTMRLSNDLVSNGLGRARQYSERKSNFKTGFVTYGEDGILLAGVVNDNQLQFASFVTVKTDGLLRVEQDKLLVTGASYATLLMNAKTNFAQDPKNNYRQNIDVVEAVKQTVNAAVTKSYADIRQAHVDDYQSLFNRVKLNITSSESSTPTNELLRQYDMQSGQQLEELFFQYGRYLMITSSRNKPNALPANLQGVWNAVDNPPWNSDYHMNVNLQMNYWPVYSTNIAETAIPLINYVDDLRYYGRIAAKEYANIVSGDGEENGWLAHTQATPFGWTTPGWSYYWGWSPASNAWIMQNVYDYYKFTRDESYLRDKIYPMLKETAKFWHAFLHYDQESDRWVSSPSYSPEHGTITIGNTFDQSLVWQLFHDYMEAANILEVDQAFVDEVRTKFEKLKPLHINQAGRIKEWYEEDTPRFTGEGVELGHRHVSELVGLFPGTLFSKDQPQFLEAARRTLNHRGDGGTGWSKANKINLWARLLDGNRAHRLLSEQLKSSTLNNLWDTHSPFQIDGNFGATSGMTEMLLQSHTGYIAPLAALPDAWHTGEVSGLVARGNVIVDMKWRDKVLTSMKLTARKGGVLQLDYPSLEHATVKLNGKIVTPKVIQDNRIELMTREGDVLTFESFIGRVNRVTAERNTGHSAIVRFNAMEGARKYTIEREDLLATTEEARMMYFDTDRTTYEDKSISPGRSYRYTVKAHLGNIVTAASDASVIDSVKLILDDRDPAIQYGGLYGDWSDSMLHGGTEKYADLQLRPSATPEEATATLRFLGTGIEIYGLKTPNLGQALVTIDGQAVGELDFYAPTTNKKVLIGRYADLNEGWHTLTLRVKPQHKGRPGERAKISLDYFRIIVEDPSLPEVLDDRDARIIYGSEYQNWEDATMFGGTEKYADLNHKTNVAPEAATLTLPFNGTGIRIYGIKSSALGRAIVTLDGQPVTHLDFYKNGNTEKGVLIGEYANLSDGAHTITIQVDPNSPVGKKKISLDYFEILKPEREVVQAPRLSDIQPEDEVLKVTLPTGEWTSIRLVLPGVETAIVLTQNSAGQVISTHGAVRTGDDGQVHVVLPTTFSRTGPRFVYATATRGEEESNSVVASIIVRTSELVDGEREQIPYDSETLTDDTKYTDYREVRSAGAHGERLYKNRIHKINDVIDTTKTEHRVESVVVRPPVKAIYVIGTKPIDTVEEITREEVLAYVTEKQADHTLPLGEERIQVQGKNGTLAIRVRQYTHKGIVVREEELSRTITVQPVNQVVLVGTKESGTSQAVRIYSDDATGVKLTISPKEPILPSKVAIAHSEQPTPTTHPALIGRDYDLYDIALFDQNGHYIHLQYGASVDMPVDAGKVIDQVYYLPTDGTAQPQNFQQKDGRVHFNVPHFSQYAIVYVATPPVHNEKGHSGEQLPPLEESLHVEQIVPTPPSDSLSQPTIPSSHVATTPVSAPMQKAMATLPETGEDNTYAIFSASALVILASIGLIATRKQEE